MIDMTKWEQIAHDTMLKRKPGAPGRLSGRISIVTGSAQGFGQGIAEEIYREGAFVVVADLNEPLAQKVARNLGERAIAVRVDVTDEQSVADMIARTVEHFGGLDLMISNAGVLRAGSLDQMEKKDFEFVTAVNYTAFFTCTRYASRIMRAQRKADPTWMGDIITINSKSGLQGSNKNFAYAGGKFGGIGLVQSFAMELAEYGIKVNAICPGNFYDGPLWSDPDRGLFVQDILTPYMNIQDATWAEGWGQPIRCLDDYLGAIEERLAALGDELRTSVQSANVRAAKVLASNHQAEFARWLGLEVVATFVGSDVETISNIDHCLKQTAGQEIRFVVANQQEGAALAGALADRLGARAVVFSNFPSQADKATGFDRLLRDNVQGLIAAVTP